MSDPYSSKPWLKHYDPHVPEKLNYPWTSFIDMARKTFREVPDRAAMIYIDTVITFGELLGRTLIASVKTYLQL